MRRVLFVLFVFLVGCSSKNAVNKSENPTCAVIHRPSSGCPNGYEQEKNPRFIEKDGSKVFACVSGDQTKEQCVDVLNPGETMEMRFEFQVDPGPPANDQPAKAKS